MIIVTKDNFQSEVENSDKLVLIDLYADWCGPCKMLGQVLDTLDDIEIIKVNVDEMEIVTKRHGK